MALQKTEEEKETKSKKRRTELINETINTIAEVGISGASIEKITERAGVSRGLVRYYFRNKAELLQATYRYIALEYWQIMVNDITEGTVQQKLNRFVDSGFDPIYARREIVSAWVALTETSRTDQGLYEIYEEASKLYRKQLIPLFRAVMGEDVDSKEIELAADGLAALGNGLWLDLSLKPGEYDLSRAREIWWHYVKQLSRGDKG
jgi:TetR/AcrR family transcriptional regulator, transcriptional repressor of bet genes